MAYIVIKLAVAQYYWVEEIKWNSDLLSERYLAVAFPGLPSSFLGYHG